MTDQPELTLEEMVRLRHYDELREQYIVERDLARSAEARIYELERIIINALEDLTSPMADDKSNGVNRAINTLQKYHR